MGDQLDLENDAILSRIGNFGKWQLRSIGVVQFVGLISGWQLLSTTFLMPNHDFWCSPEELNIPVGTRVNWTSPAEDNNTEVDHCSMYEVDYSSPSPQDYLDEHPNVSTIPCSRWDYSREMTPHSVVSQFDLVCANDILRSASKSAYFGGKMVGGIVGGMLSDRFGRKKIMILTSFLTLVFGCCISLAPSMLVFTILRCLVAATTTALFAGGFVYCLEIVGGNWSTFIGVGVLEYSWAMGYVTVPLIAWIFPVWTHLQVAISLPVLLFVACLLIPSLIPESPRWLNAKGFVKEANAILDKAAEMNGMTENTARSDAGSNDVNKNAGTSDKDSKTEAGTSDQDPKAEEKSSNILDLFRTPNIRRSTFIIYYLWFTNNLVYYGLTLNTGKLLPGNLYINTFVSGILELVAYTLTIFAFLKLGRRWSISSAMLFCGLALMVTAVVEVPLAKTVLSQLGKFAITCSFAMIWAYAVEIFPTVVRSSGMGSSSCWSRIGSIIAPFIGRELGRFNPAAPLLIFGFTSFAAGLLTLLLPETKNRALPDTIEEGERFIENQRVRLRCCKKTETIDNNTHL